MNTDNTHCGNNAFSESRTKSKGISVSNTIDGVNTQSLGLGAAYSTNLSYLSASMNGQLAQFNMAADQQRQAMLALAVAAQAATGKKSGISKSNRLDAMSQAWSGASPVEEAMVRAENCMSAAGGTGKVEGLAQASVPNGVQQ